MINFIVLIAILIYIFRNADFDYDEPCVPDEKKCRACPFPCDKRKN